MHGEHKLEKYTHRIFLALGRQIKAQSKVRMQGTDSPKNLYQILLLSDCTGIFHLAVSFRLSLLATFPNDCELRGRACICASMHHVSQGGGGGLLSGRVGENTVNCTVHMLE